MRVALTGATGMVGGHTADQLLRAGHDVVALVRSRERLADTMASFGHDTPECVVGDMTDPVVVGRLLDGADAVIHCAALVTLDRRDESRMLRDNPAGVKAVVGGAVERGLDPIVYLSSAGAVFDPDRAAASAGQRRRWRRQASTTAAPLSANDDIAEPDGAYGRSKARSEAIVRAYQDDGAPVVIVYPGGILGPAAGGALGEAGRGFAQFLGSGVLPTPDGRVSIIDVRDLADILAAVIEPERGPRRIMCGGHAITMDELGDVLRAHTGRRFPVLPLPGAVWRSMGTALDKVKRWVPWDTVVSGEAMTFLTRWPGTADNVDDVGIELRPFSETLGASLQAWADAGYITDRQLGRAASLVTPHGS